MLLIYIYIVKPDKCLFVDIKKEEITLLFAKRTFGYDQQVRDNDRRVDIQR